VRTACSMLITGEGSAVRAAQCKFTDLLETAAVAECGAILSMQVRALCSFRRSRREDCFPECAKTLSIHTGITATVAMSCALKRAYK
jgi:hypothetical protein